MDAAVHREDMPAIGLNPGKEPLTARTAVEHGLLASQPLAQLQSLTREIGPNDRLAMLLDPRLEGLAHSGHSGVAHEQPHSIPGSKVDGVKKWPSRR